jgi:hypothetical protein
MQKKTQSLSDWPIKFGIVIFGSVIVLFGYLGHESGYAWFISRNPNAGRSTITTPWGIVALGMIFVLIGILPWKRISVWLEQRDARKKAKQSR